MNGSVDLERSSGVVRITLNRPGKRNAMTDAMWVQFEAHLASLEPADRVLVVTGAGDAFCGGSDVAGLLDDADSLPSRIEVSNRCVLAMRELPIPTIARVDGIAAGSALNLALACDFVLASERARFAQLFVHIGLSLDSGASWLLPRLVGERKARELCFLGEEVTAPEAVAMGMITSVHEDLDEAVDGLVTRLAALSPHALAGTKRMLGQAWQHGLAGALRAETTNQLDVITTDIARQKIAAFAAPRETRR
jgi:2-(1,2-epoxy-1,2-dihydrophenyl)acetyl-CoA isomerase